MSESTVISGPGLAVPVSLGSFYYPNLENFPGQVNITPALTQAQDELNVSRKAATRSARASERLSPHVRAGLTKKADMTVGATLRVTSIPDYVQLGWTPKQARKVARQFESLFHSWGYDRRNLQDGEGHFSFGGMMWMSFRNLIGPDGETAGIIHYDRDRAERYGTKWGTYVTVLDPQRIDTPPEQAGAVDVVEGRKIDADGRMIGFYYSAKRPGVDAMDGVKFEYRPRETSFGRPMAWHWFQKHRGAAHRGITTMVNMLKRSNMLDRYDSALLAQAVLAASSATYIKTKGDPQQAGSALRPGSDPKAAINPMDWKIAFYDKAKIRFDGNARVPILAFDDELIMESAEIATADPTAFRNGFLREFAAALGLPFESFSLNYSETNYSSARASLIDIWRGILVERVMFCHAVPSLIFDAVIEEAIIQGRVELPAGAPNFYEFREAYTRCFWTGPGMGWVDPKKEAEAAAIRLDPSKPLSTLTDELGEDGKSFEEVAMTRAAEQDMLYELGLAVDPKEKMEAEREAAQARQPAGSPPDDNKPQAVFDMRLSDFETRLEAIEEKRN